MTKEEFIAGYCERSKIPWETLSEWMVALPCFCGEPSCEGWAMVTPSCVDWHMKTSGLPPADEDGKHE